MNDRGRTVVLFHIAIALAATIAMIAVQILSDPRDNGFYNPEQSAWRHFVRIVVTVGVCAWLYRGSKVARWIVIVVFGSAGLLGLINFLSGGFAAFVMGISSAAYLSLAAVCLTSLNAKAFLQVQRATAGRKGLDEAPV